MNGTRSTLLIVYDEPSCREAFRWTLEDNYHLIEAASGEDALNILDSGQNIDLMLLDYLLPPGMNELEVLRHMTASGYSVPVILVTGHGSQIICRDAFKVCVNDYIIKPFTVNVLLATIKGVPDPPEENKSPVDQAIEPVIQAIAFMEERYCQPISAREVAHGIGYSYSHLAHLFLKEEGCSISSHLNRIRID
jgi:DNA-binding NtrC family response regulator